MTDLRARFLAEVRKEIGTPYRLQGRLAGVGLDCAGLPVVAARRAGLEVVEAADYGRRPDPALLLRCLEATGLKRLHGLHQALPGDLLVLRFEASPRHLAVVSHVDGDQIRIVHAWLQKRKVVEHDLPAEWRPLLFSVYRFPES